MIITRQKHVPWSWVFLTHLPWAAMLFASAVNTIIFTLEVRKFTANPAAIASIITLTGFITMFTSPVVNWLSDRVWTRWGRRKIFYVPATVAQGTIILFIPWAPNLGVLVAMYFCNFIFISISHPKESLAQEVVPNHQRGRASVLHSIFVQMGLMAYNLALIGRFDDVYPNNPLSRFLGSITGEHLMFWVFSLALFSIVLIVTLGIKEIKPPKIPDMKAEFGGKITPWRFVRHFFVDCFSGSWWPIYMLALCQMLYGLSLGGMVALMYTDQWAYSAQALGTNQGIIQILSVFVLMGMSAFIDRFDRIKLFTLLILTGMALKFFWYGYVMLYVPDQRPSLLEILLIGEMIGVVGSLAGVITYPLVYEFVPLDKMGTANAGLGLFRGFTGMILGPLMGIWILWFSSMTMPGPGSSVIAVLDEPVTQQAMDERIGTWEADTGDTYYAKPYRPYGVNEDTSQQWEMRILDRDAEQIQKEIEQIEAELLNLQRDIDTYALRAEDAPQEMFDEKAAFQAQLEAKRTELAGRAEEFRRFLDARLGEDLAEVEEGLLGASFSNGTVRVSLQLVYPLDEEKAGEIAGETRLKLESEGWSNVVVRTEGNGGRRLEASAIPPENLEVTIEGAASSLAQLVQSRLTGGEANNRYAGILGLTTTVEEVVVGHRNNVIMPFAHPKFAPQRVDYFSSYILMALTDAVAILIVVLIIYLEKKGRITRRGKLEDEAANA